MRSLPGRNRNRYTAAVSNKRIKENLVKVDAEFAEDIHIRIPVIPTVNMNENNMNDTIKFLSNLKHIKDIELLPYHRLGLETYERLGRCGNIGYGNAKENGGNYQSGRSRSCSKSKR